MPLHVIKRGLDIPMKGRATGEPVQIDPPATVGYTPTEFKGVTPRLVAREGDEVKVGSPLFESKIHPAMKFLSPVAGRVKEIRRGRRRVITDIVVERTGDEAESLRTWAPSDLAGISREDAVACLQAGGLWTSLRTRPMDRVADPGVRPQSILVGAMETGPLQPGPEVLLGAGDGEFLQAGINVLRSLTEGRVYLAVQEGSSHPALSNVQGVEVHSFKGPHPAGDPGVQVNHVDQPVGSNQVWWTRAWEVALIGRLFLEGRFPTERVYAAVGPAVKNPRFVKTVLGAPVASIVGEVAEGDLRWISGSALTGSVTAADRWAGFHSSAITVLSDEVERELLAWVLPQFSRWSAHRAFLRGFFKSSTPVDFRTGINGGQRTLIPVPAYQKVVATPDIDVAFLFKSIIAGDFEESLVLGLLDITMEEAALLTYVCPAKIEFDVWLQKGLERYVKEM
ncbi:MAG: NADH:ubiquinone reductase (Na(+)-transporting) subunit A [Deltaproteobacteria bacterium]|nr:NADH:ubiquinone reductase (Na(+)-transporting) subunit A [Deltaproteobacteria bacterium]MBW2254533.1 NADH:ubiquinone reductase (Na(+)-transporting) subunit A [Deltaproteobacteria bacterium]